MLQKMLKYHMWEFFLIMHIQVYKYFIKFGGKHQIWRKRLRFEHIKMEIEKDC